jgi:hypothetical protein
MEAPHVEGNFRCEEKALFPRLNPFYLLKLQFAKPLLVSSRRDEQ